MCICDFCGTPTSTNDNSVPVSVVRYRLFDPELASRQPNSHLDQQSWELCPKCQKDVKKVIRTALEDFAEKRKKERK